ncbi:protein kinase domain-containing protein [Sorangium sp. So ce1335]|uniref:protein kinase domain-containing protein n=1 Tax=Sorangium sp. So ce1335 TaxID=3133335 RepID=UPI003F6015BF
MLIAERFVIEREVGAGGMGAVYRAIDRTSGAPVALKLVTSDDHRFHARARVEAEVLAALDHPALVRLVASGRMGDGRPFLAMEWLDGEDLAARLARSPVTVREAISIGVRVAEGLAATHARGVVHRDLKPSNIVLPGGDAAQAKLVDFGIARIGHLGRRLTATGALLGTPGYMAPEQVQCVGDVGPPADLFALGAVLFECLTGCPAFLGDTPLAVFSKILLDEPPRIEAFRAGLPASLGDHIARLLAKAPAQRPTAGECAAALASLLHAHGDGAPRKVPAAAAMPSGEQRLACVLLVRPAQAPPGVPAGDASPTVTVDPDTLSATPPVEHGAGGDALAALREAIAPFGGQADRLLDGALVARWCGVGAARDQAGRAARAALEAAQRLPDAAIALASGLTDVRGLLPLGPVLDRAAALVEAPGAPPGAVLVDEVTAGLLDARFELRASPAGLHLVGRRTLNDGEARLLLGQPSPCVGRERELRALADLLDQCVDEAVARAVLVVAPPGIGKSRLRHEMLGLVRRRGDVEVWAADADELGSDTPYALLGAALQRAADAHPGDPVQERRRRLEERVARHVPEPERARVAVFLGEIIAAPFPASAHPTLAAARRTPAMMAEQIRRAFLDLLAAETAAHPLMLVLEDLHWADVSSVELAGAALAALRDRPFMAVGLARPEIHDRFSTLWAEHDVQEMRLGRLTRRAAAQLVAGALPAADDALVARLVDRADGNPLYLEELIRAVAEGRGDTLPETVAAMVQARLEILPADERRVLRAASVFGDVFWRGAVEALVDGGAPDQEPSAHGRAGAHLASLVAKEVLVRRLSSQLPGEPEFAFRHALLREGAYAMLTADGRALGHRLAGGWLERQAAPRGAAPSSPGTGAEPPRAAARPDAANEASAARIARHFELGRAPDRAAAWYARAAEHALRAGDPGDAGTCAARGLALLAETPRTEGRLDQELALQIFLATALAITRGHAAPEVERAFSRALELCQGEEDAHARIVTLFGLWRLHIGRGEHWTARAFGEDLLALARTRGGPEAALAAHHALGKSCLFLGEHGNARQHLQTSVGLYDRARHHDISYFYGGDFEVQGLSYLAITLWALGAMDQALSTTRRACAIAEGLGHPFTVVLALSLAAVHHQVRRDRRTTLEYAERALSLATRHECRHYVQVATILRGWALAERGQREDVVEEMRLAIADQRAEGTQMSMTHLLALEAEARAAVGQEARALATLAEAEATMDGHAERFWAPEVYRLKAAILHGSAAPSDTAAEDCLLRALDIARCQGALTLELRATANLARLWRVQGNAEEAQEALAGVLARVAEGPGTRDVEEARALLEELSRGPRRPARDPTRAIDPRNPSP